MLWGQFTGQKTKELIEEDKLIKYYLLVHNSNKAFVIKW